MSLLAVRDRIVSTLKAGVPGLRSVVPHAGRFTAEDLSRYSQQAPVGIVSCLAASKIDEEGGSVTPHARWAAFVLTRDTPNSKRHDAAIAFAQAILLEVAGNRWGLEGVHRPAALQLENLYAGPIDKAGVALWAVTWIQAVDLELTDAAALAALTKVHADYDLAPADGTIAAADDVTLEAP